MTEIQVSKRQYHEIGYMINWCREYVGTGGYIIDNGDRWSIETAFGESTFSFVDSKDATLFALRWK